MRRIHSALLASALVCIGCSNPADVPEASKWETDVVVGTVPGYQAPAFTLRDTSGTEVSLKQFRGSVVLLDFWASWCGPCLTEIPLLRELHRDYRDSGLVILSVSLDLSRTSWKKYLSNYELPWTHVYDENVTASVTDRYGVVGIPSNFVLNRYGVIVEKNVHGPALETAIQSELRR